MVELRRSPHRYGSRCWKPDPTARLLWAYVARRGTSLRVVEDLATRFADLLESTAQKVRSLTIDRARTGITIAALAIPALVFAVFVVVFLFITIHSALAIPLGQWGAYAVEAGVFLIAGVLVWVKRDPKEST